MPGSLNSSHTLVLTLTRKSLVSSTNSATTGKNPRRRWLQFSLTMLLLLVTGLAVLFTWLGRQARQSERESRVAAMIEELGGKVTWRGFFEGRGKDGRSYVGAVDLSETKVSDAELAEIALLPELTHLRLNNTAITSAGLTHLIDLRHLKQLELANTSISDEGLREIGKMSSLEVLKLGGTDISNDGLAHVAGLDSLWMLYLDGTPITDDGLQHVARLGRLRTLNVDDTTISNAGLTFLQGHKELEILSVQGTKVTEAALNPMTMQKLRTDPAIVPIYR
jgi:hypothetical protein